MLNEAISDAQGDGSSPFPAEGTVHAALPAPRRTRTLEPRVSQTEITTAILCRQAKAAEVAACHTNSRSQDHEKEGYDRVLK